MRRLELNDSACRVRRRLPLIFGVASAKGWRSRSLVRRRVRGAGRPTLTGTATPTKILDARNTSHNARTRLTLTHAEGTDAEEKRKRKMYELLSVVLFPVLFSSGLKERAKVKAL